MLVVLGPTLLKLVSSRKSSVIGFVWEILEKIPWYLGIEIIRDWANWILFIDQTAFIDRMFEDLRMEKCRSAKVPIDFGTGMVKNRYMGEDYEATKKEIQEYQSLFGTLLWLACMTRPDISFAVRKCSRYASNPTPSHDVALKKIVRYLKWSKELGLRYRLRLENNDVKLLGYTDASYGDCLDTRCSNFE